MHIVHVKEEYDSLAEASKDSRSVAVWGFFFQVLGKHHFKKNVQHPVQTSSFTVATKNPPTFAKGTF